VANLRGAVIPLITELADISLEQRHITAGGQSNCTGVLDLTRCGGAQAWGAQRRLDDAKYIDAGSERRLEGVRLDNDVVRFV